MDGKTASTMGAAGSVGIALMLAMIGVLYGYNTFMGSAVPVQAQSSPTDRGPNWTVTTVSADGQKQYIVVITQTDVPQIGIEGPTRQMSIYELSTRGNAKAQVWFVAARVLEYDAQVPEVGDFSADRNWGPAKVKEWLEDDKKKGSGRGGRND